MPTIPGAANTLASLQAVQAAIIAGMGTSFAALTAADQARYGVARAVYIGVPKDFSDGYLPQCHIVPESDTVSRAGAQGRAEDTLLARVTAVADYTDWWQGEQTILSLRDQLWAVVLAHARGGAAPGADLAALDLPGGTPGHGDGFALLQVAGVWYRTWSAVVRLRQVWVVTGGLVP